MAAHTVSVMRAMEKAPLNPARQSVAKAIYESLRDVGVDPPWLAVSGMALDKWLMAADAALEAHGGTDIEDRLRRVVDDLEDIINEVD